MSVSRSVNVLRVARMSSARAVIAPRLAKSVHTGRLSSSSSSLTHTVKRTLPYLSVQIRGYAASSGLSHQEIQNRIVEVLKSFEKVDPAKVSNSSSFTSDLGLDSLDAVEVVMAIEEEFSIEIPDAEADNITTVQQAIDYIAKTPEAH